MNGCILVFTRGVKQTSQNGSTTPHWLTQITFPDSQSLDLLLQSLAIYHGNIFCYFAGSANSSIMNQWECIWHSGLVIGRLCIATCFPINTFARLLWLTIHAKGVSEFFIASHYVLIQLRHSVPATYTVSTDTLNWGAARAACKKQSADLVSIETEQENKCVKDKIQLAGFSLFKL